MRTLKLLSALVALSLLASPAFAQIAGVPAGARKVKLNDQIRANQIDWTSAAPMEKIKGTAPGVKGDLSIDPAKLEAMTGKFWFAVMDMKTGNTTRDRHLQGSEWLNAEKNPNITFEIASVAVRKVDGDKASVDATGSMEVNGVKKRITVPVTLSWKVAGEQTSRVAGDWVKIDTKFDLKLADYKIAGKAGVVGSKVGESIAISATLYGHTVQ